MNYTIDLNCDLGEGMGNDTQIMPYISSCNIACGGHFGTIESIKQALQLALKFNVKAGAHPSFEDAKNFGRVQMQWSRVRFRESVLKQLQQFQTAAVDIGSELHHIKMHGALYHATAHVPEYANWTVELLQEFYPSTPIYSLPDSFLHQKCKQHGQPFMKEAFADRAYKADGFLIPRADAGGVFTTINQVKQQLIELIKNKRIVASDGTIIPMVADSFCIHGDNIEIIKQLPELIKLLDQNDISIA
ncbi:LamB/YcsF family protein [Nonlabens antarcticus]|uniref:LamB/YcsF family protein n=1 Tax=Nonlabens antarcticus TaxID=392714 RepID=UPI0018912552|nr:LamB/YcsF family protein [Nonlabens antarcticus]